MARKLTSSLIREERGQSLVIIVIAMFVIAGVAALAIDASTWYVRHHQDQVVADSAALAAANCLANPKTSGTTTVNGQTLPVCSSDTDTTDAQNLAVAYAAANGLSITTNDVVVDTSAGTVTVTASTTSPAFFGRAVGIVSGSQKAMATATYKPSIQNPCGTAGSNCDLFFAKGSNCVAGAEQLYIYFQGSSTINGGIGTNGNLATSMTGNSGGITGTGTYGYGINPDGTQTCSSNPELGKGNHDPWNSSSPSMAGSALNWPINYAPDFPACYTGSTAVTGESPCQTTGPNTGYPDWCTVTSATWSSLIPVPGNIYCDAGTGTNVNTADPNTWNGQITLASGSWTSDTFVAGGLTYSGSSNHTWSSCGYSTNGYNGSGVTTPCTSPVNPATTYNYPIFYIVGQDTNTTTCVYTQVSSNGTPDATGCALSLSSTGQLNLEGDTFVPNGTIFLSYTGGSSNDGFFEANTIIASLAGNYSGDGPSLLGGSGGATLGTDSLIQ